MRDMQRDSAGTKRANACPTPAEPAGQTIEPTEAQSEFDERAAIVQFDGGVRRQWAEGFALLDTARPPRGFTPERWRQLIDDGGRFLDRWAHQAAERGWSAEQVFGVDSARPPTRYQNAGLVSLIGGGEVIDVRADRATIRMARGNCLTYYLRRLATGVVVIWELAPSPR